MDEGPVKGRPDVEREGSGGVADASELSGGDRSKE